MDADRDLYIRARSVYLALSWCLDQLTTPEALLLMVVGGLVAALAGCSRLPGACRGRVPSAAHHAMPWT
jgi:hypothetical protein